MIKGDKVCITILINNVNALEVEKKREFSEEHCTGEGLS